MSWEDSKRLAAAYVEKTDRFVKGTRYDNVALGIVIDAEDVVFMATKGLDAILRLDVVDSDRFIIRGGADVLGIGRPGEIGNALKMSCESANLLPIQGIPNADSLVCGGGGEKAAVRREFDG